MMKKDQPITLLLSLFLFLTVQLPAATYYSIGTGNWNDGTRWSTTGFNGSAAGTYPGQLAAGDIVKISGYAITVNASPPFGVASVELLQTNTFSLADTRLYLPSGVTLVSGSFLMQDNNVNSHMELEVAYSAVFQVSGNATVNRGVTNAKDKRMRIYLRNSGIMKVNGNLSYTYGRAFPNETAESEILVESSALLQVMGQLGVTMGNVDGDNNKMDILVQSNGKIEAGSVSLVLKTSDDGDDVIVRVSNSTFKCTGLWNANINSTATLGNSLATFIDGGTVETGNMTCTQDGGGAGDLSLLLNQISAGYPALLKVNGDLKFSHSAGDNMELETNANSTVDITGKFDVNVSSGSSGDVVTLDMNGGTVTIGDLLNALVVSNNNHFYVLVDGGASLTAKGICFNQQGIGTGDMNIYLNASGTAAFSSVTAGIYGIVFYDYGGDNMDITLEGNSKMTVNGDVRFYNYSGDGNDRQMIRLNLGTVDPVFAMTGNFTGHIYSGSHMNDQVFIDINDGSFTCGGNMSLTTGGSSTNGTHCNIDIDYGTLTVTGLVKLDHLGGGSSSNDRITLDNGAMFTAGSLLLNGQGGKDTYFESQNASQALIRGDVTLMASGPGKTYIDLNSFSSFSIQGNFVRGTPRYGTLTSSPDAWVRYVGTNPQVIAGDMGSGGDHFQYSNVEINNTYSVIPQMSMTAAEGNATIYEFLRLTRGVIASLASAMPVIEEHANSDPGNPSCYVDGPVKKIGHDPGIFTFPVGDGTIWARLGMSNLSNFSANTEFTCQYFYLPAPNNTPAFMGISVGPKLDHVSYVEYWDLQRVFDPGDNAGCQVTLYWENAARSGITSGADLRVAHFHTPTTNKWENHGQSTLFFGSSGYISSAVNLDEFSPVTFGSGNGVNPLPIELTHLKAYQSEEIVVVEWVTASETNNDYFTVERSADARNYEWVGELDGSGTTSAPHSYSLPDPYPLPGVSYYRLKQTDFNGAYTYSDPVAVQVSNYAAPSVMVIQQPVVKEIRLLVMGMEGQQVSTTVSDVMGRTVLSRKVWLDKEELVIDCGDLRLSDGVYSVLINGGGHSVYAKFVVSAAGK